MRLPGGSPWGHATVRQLQRTASEAADASEGMCDRPAIILAGVLVP